MSEAGEDVRPGRRPRSGPNLGRGRGRARGWPIARGRGMAQRQQRAPGRSPTTARNSVPESTTSTWTRDQYQDRADDDGESAGLASMSLEDSPKPGVPETQSQVDSTIGDTDYERTHSGSKTQEQAQTRVTNLEGKQVPCCCWAFVTLCVCTVCKTKDGVWLHNVLEIISEVVPMFIKLPPRHLLAAVSPSSIVVVQ